MYEMYEFTYVCSHFKFLLIGSPALRVNIMKNITNSSIVVQWDAVDDFLPTTYTVTWTDDRDLHEVATVNEQTSYTITGLTLDTVYTITVSIANKCGQGTEFQTRILFFAVTTSTTTTISPTASTNTPTISIIRSTTTTATITTASAITTTNSMTASVSRDTVNTIKSTSLLALSSNIGTATTTTTIVTKCFGMYLLLLLLLSPIIYVYIHN